MYFYFLIIILKKKNLINSMFLENMEIDEE